MNNKSVWFAVVVVAIIAIGGYFFPKLPILGFLGGTTNYDTLSASTIKVGSGCNDGNSTCTAATTLSGTTLTQGTSGTAITNLSVGTCYIKAYATTIAATSSATVDCQATALVDQSTGRIGSALTGVLVGDRVQITLSTTTASLGTGGGIVLNGASASTTAGYIVLSITNMTGGTFTWPTTNFNAATGTASYIDSR